MDFGVQIIRFLDSYLYFGFKVAKNLLLKKS